MFLKLNTKDVLQNVHAVLFVKWILNRSC